MAKDKIEDLIERANDLLDDYEKRGEAIAILRSVIEKAPTRVEALYYLAWALLLQNPSDRSEAEGLLPRILENTQDLTRDDDDDDDEPSVEARARAFALSWGVPARCVHATKEELKELTRLGKEAWALRESLASDAARRAARMGMVWADARAQGKPEVGFQKLLDWVKAHPNHSSWSDSEESSDPDDQTSCAGLEPFFDDPAYLEWVRQQKPKPAKHSARLFYESLCAAAGADAEEGQGNGMTAVAGTGRRGRILSLLALGAKLDDSASISWSENLLANAALYADASLVRFLMDLGAPIDGRESHVPLISAVMSMADREAALRGIRILLEAGANPNHEVKGGNGKKTSPILAAAKSLYKEQKLDLLRGGKPAPPVQKKPGGLDTAPARAIWAARKKALSKAKWSDGSEELDELFDLIDNEGVPTWEAAAEHLEDLDANKMFALALVLKELSASAEKKAKPVELTKKDHGKRRIVIGDAVVKGDALLGNHTDWLVTGNLHAEGRFANDETARIAVGGNMTGTMIETEGELYVGGDLTIDQVVWAEYEAGDLVVVGSLKTKVLIEKNHGVIAGKRDVEHRLKDTTRKAAGKVFPEAAFGSDEDEDELDGKKLWVVISKR